MKAILCTHYGPPEVLHLANIEKPRAGPDEVLVRVHAAAVSVSDCIIRSGKVDRKLWLPFRIYVGFGGPRHPVLGLEFSGEVESVGAKVARFKAGDEVFGFTGRGLGAYAEYACLREGGRFMPYDPLIVTKPLNISHAEAATAPTRATLAYYFLKQAKIERGKKVLIYGASGGIGTFAVQFAKQLGAKVTAMCSAANLELVKSLGADCAIDYTDERAAITGDRYDVIFDAVGSKKSSPAKPRCWAALAKRGRSVSVEGSVKIPGEYLNRVAELMAAGTIRPVVDKVYGFAEAQEAHGYVETGHKRGGVAIRIVDDQESQSPSAWNHTAADSGL